MSETTFRLRGRPRKGETAEQAQNRRKLEQINAKRKEQKKAPLTELPA